MGQTIGEVAMRRRSSADARLAKIMPGRRAGKDHARTQGPLRGERPSVPVCFAGQSPSVASLAFGEASSDCVGQAKTIEKEHCGEVRCAHERKEREETNRIGDEICPITCISFISL